MLKLNLIIQLVTDLKVWPLAYLKKVGLLL
jgi:hypothetical protein